MKKSQPQEYVVEEIPALIETLLNSEQRLRELTSGEVDSVATKDGRTFLLRHAQEQLRDSEAGKQAAILNALPACIALVNAQGVIISVNEAWRRFADANELHAPGHGVGLNYLEICDRAHGDHSAEARRVADGIRSVLSNRENSFSLEYPCNSATKQRWFLLMVTPLAGNQSNGAVVMHLEITQRRLAADALRGSRDEFRALAEAMPQMVWIAQPDGGNIYISQQWMDYTGLTIAETFGEGWIKAFHPEDQHRASEAWAQARKETSIYNIQSRLRRADGVYRWWLIRGVPQRDASGSITKWFGTCTDIHELKVAEIEISKSNSALRESEEKFRQLADHITDVFWITSPDLKTLHYVSAGYELIWGRSTESLHSNPHQWIEVIVPEDRERVIAVFDALMGHEREVNVEYRIALPDGTVRWIHDHGFQILDAAGKLIRLTGIASDITERKQADAQRERLADIVEASPDFIGFADPKTRQIQYINKHGRKMCGIKEDEDITKLKISDVHPAWMNERFAEVILPAAVRDGLWKGEGAFLHRNGREIPISMALVARKAADGEIDILFTVSRDITDRKEAEELMRASEERYRSLFESNPSPMWIYDLETLSFLAVNAAAVRQYGYSRDEFLAMTIKDIRPTEDLPALMDDLSKEAAEADNSMGWRHCKKDGTLIDVEIASHELTWLGRRTKLVLISDITERKRGEDRLREQAKLLDLAHDAIMVRDMEDRVEFWNQGAERLYGWTAAEVEGKAASSFLYDGDPADTAAARACVIKNGSWTGEFKHFCKDGGNVMIRTGWTLVRDELGEPKSILIINTDVTEQKKLETHLLRAQRLESIGTLASGVAHDLNNILTPILMCAEVLKKNPMPEDLPPLISMIEDSARRGASVVKQVLTFARGIEGERVAIKPSQLIQEMIEVAQKTFPKTIEILSRYPADLWLIEGDPTQLHQVLLNLSVNARDAMPNGGSLTFGAENFNVDENYASMMPGSKPGPHVMLRVADTGDGMRRALVDKIFDPFFTTKEVGKGTGLGLSTALGIVRGHRGFISVYSEPGNGTTFNVFLPAAAVQEGSAQSKTSIAPIQGNGELILVVDDEPNILGITKMILEKHKYSVISANDGPEALAIFAQQMKSISLVLTDLSMPYMDGIALVRSLKKMRPDVSIIASTGQSEQGSVAELQSLGVKNFLTKPYNTERLLATLNDTLHGRESGSSEIETTSR